MDSDFLSHDTVAQMMQPIKAELDSCKGCWEEGISRIDRLQKKKPNTGNLSFDIARKKKKIFFSIR